MKNSWIKLEIKFDYEISDGEESRILADVNYLPERPAPPCSNPDSPAFSDSGDPDELEIFRAVILKDGVQTPLADTVINSDRFIDICYDEARNFVESMENDY